MGGGEGQAGREGGQVKIYCFTCGTDCDEHLGEPYVPLQVIGLFWHRRLPDKYRSEAAYRAAWYPASQSRCRWRELKKLGFNTTRLYVDPYLQGSTKPWWLDLMEV